MLTLRFSQGQELDQLASHDLREFFPELKPGVKFFLSDDGARKHLYSLGSNEDVIWAATDALRIYRYRDGRSSLILSEELTPLPYPEAERSRLLARKERTRPPYTSSSRIVILSSTISPSDPAAISGCM